MSRINRMNGMNPPPTTTANSMSTPASIVRRRRRLQPGETALLTRVFEQYPRPTAAMRELLAQQLGMSARGVQIWFQNRRAKVKRDLMESGQAMLLFTPTYPGNLTNGHSSTGASSNGLGHQQHQGGSNGGGGGGNGVGTGTGASLPVSLIDELSWWDPQSQGDPSMTSSVSPLSNVSSLGSSIGTTNVSSPPCSAPATPATIINPSFSSSAALSSSLIVPSAEELERLMREMLEMHGPEHQQAHATLWPRSMSSVSFDSDLLHEDE